MTRATKATNTNTLPKCSSLPRLLVRLSADNFPREDGSRHCSPVLYHRVRERENREHPLALPPAPTGYIPEWVWEYSRSHGIPSDHHKWLARLLGDDEAERIAQLYGMGTTKDGHAIFWQRDIEGRVRTGKIMAYDPISGHRKKEAGSINWVHSIMQQRGQLPEDWQLTQCLYGEHLLPLHPDAVVGIVEAYKTAHVGAILHPDMVWLATDSLSGLTAERLTALKGRRVILYPDEGKGHQQWSERIPQIAKEIGFSYRISEFVEEHLPHGSGADIADMVISEEACPF